MTLESKLHTLIDPLATALGYVLWGLSYRLQGGEGILSVFVDKPGGVTLADCEHVSRRIGALLDVEAVMSHRYRLEVSSPGLPRPLLQPEHYTAYVGHGVRLKLDRVLNGTRQVMGKIEEVTATQVAIQTKETTVAIPFSHIVKAHLVDEWGML